MLLYVTATLKPYRNGRILRVAGNHQGDRPWKIPRDTVHHGRKAAVGACRPVDAQQQQVESLLGLRLDHLIELAGFGPDDDIGLRVLAVVLVDRLMAGFGRLR